MSNSNPVAPKKKKGGFLAIFGCCGVPDDANGLDTPVPNHKLDRIPSKLATVSRRTATPSEQPSASKTQLSEKEPVQQSQPTQEQSKNGKRVSGTSTQDQSTVGERDGESKQTTIVGPGSSSPLASVEPPQQTNKEVEVVEEVVNEKDEEGDVQMPDAAEESQQASHAADATTEESYTNLPPPPPGPVPAATTTPTSGALIESPPVFPPDQPQKFLLPPQAPEFKGKKCLVLDLDETLVHSSFKVSFAPIFPFSSSLADGSNYRSFTRPISRYLLKSKATTIMSMSSSGQV